MLDAPGIMPPKIDDQDAAVLLAICDDIGRAAYDFETIAVRLLSLLKGLDAKWSTKPLLPVLEARYGVDPALPGPEWLEAAAERHTSGNVGTMAFRILDDFRTGALGEITLEAPPKY